MEPIDVIMVGLAGLGVSAILIFGGLLWKTYHPATLPTEVAAKETETAKVELIAPKERHEIVWNPAKGPEFRTASEGDIKQDELGYRPDFRVRSLGNTPIQDATVEWRIDIVGILDIVKASARLEPYPVEIHGNNIVVRAGPGRRDWIYKPRPNDSYKIDFVTPNLPGAEASIPIPVFETASWYIAALIPDGLGAELGPIPFSVTVSWTYPSVGKQEFAVVAVAQNKKPPDVDKPLIDAVLKFTVKPAQ